MRILGIDPGITGGAAVVETSSPFDVPRLIAAIDLPTSGGAAKRRIEVPALLAWVRQNNAQAAFIERAQAMPKQGSSSGFLYGRAVGAIEAVIQCAGVPLHIIEASAWKKRFNLKGPMSGGSKEDSRQRAILMFPEQAAVLARKKDHQRAEAALIAVYGSEIIINGGKKWTHLKEI